MKNKDFLEKCLFSGILILIAIIFMILVPAPKSHGQGYTPLTDTIFVNKVKVPYNGVISNYGYKKSTYRKVKVESGFITRKTDSTWLVNGREVSLNFKSKKP